MATDKKLRLVTHTNEQPLSMKLERRRAPRYSCGGMVTAVQVRDLGDQRAHRICSLQLENMSDSGLAASTDEPLEPGAKIVVFIPPHGPEHGIDRYGSVARCQPAEHGKHTVGVRFEDSPRAACA